MPVPPYGASLSSSFMHSALQSYCSNACAKGGDVLGRSWKRGDSMPRQPISGTAKRPERQAGACRKRVSFVQGMPADNQDAERSEAPLGRAAVAHIGEAGVVAGKGFMLPVVVARPGSLLKKRVELVQADILDELRLVMTPEEYTETVAVMNRQKRATMELRRWYWQVPVLAFACACMLIVPLLVSYVLESSLAIVFTVASMLSSVAIGASVQCTLIAATVLFHKDQRNLERTLDDLNEMWKSRGVAWRLGLSPPLPSHSTSRNGEAVIEVQYQMRVSPFPASYPCIFLVPDTDSLGMRGAGAQCKGPL